MAILECEGLTISFGGFVAVDEVDLKVSQGDIHAFIGPNGAGKSTTFNLISGYYRPTRGRVIFNNKNITRMPAYKRCHLGLVRSFQRASIYPKLTVYESVLMALLSFRGLTKKFFRPAQSYLSEEVERVLEDVGLSGQAQVPGESLSHGDKKRLDLAILLGADPQLVMLDEPTAGMGPEESRATVDLIRNLALERNLTVLFTEHDMPVVFDIASKITVLHQGRVIGDGAPEEVRKEEEVQKVYLGGLA